MTSCIENVFGIQLNITEEKIKNLPVYMTSGRSFYRAKHSELDFFIIKIGNKEKFGVVAFDKQLKKYQDATNKNVAFCFENLTKVQRDALLARKIPFICGSSQLYLPFLGMLISNDFKKKQETKFDKMMPATQELFLYLLYKCKNKKVIKKQAAEELGLTRTSVTRASEQLAAMNLIQQEKIGKEYQMWLVSSGLDAFECAKPFLINPVQKKMFVQVSNGMEKYPLSGEFALGKCTMLNSPDLRCVAIDKGEELVKNFTEVDVNWETDKECIEVELWKYNPMLFQKNGLADPISLYMSLQGNEDERVEASVEEYLEGYEW